MVPRMLHCRFQQGELGLWLERRLRQRRIPTGSGSPRPPRLREKHRRARVCHRTHPLQSAVEHVYAIEPTPCNPPWRVYLSTKMKTSTTSQRTQKGASPPPLDRKQDTALKLLIVMSRALNAVTEHVWKDDMERHGITPTEFAILEALYHKGPLLLGEVQRKILVTSGGITYLVDRLVEKGLVKREQCPEDRRARYAVLTSAGQALIKKIFPTHAARIEQAMSGLTQAEQREATALLRKLGLAVAARTQSEETEDA